MSNKNSNKISKTRAYRHITYYVPALLDEMKKHKDIIVGLNHARWELTSDLAIESRRFDEGAELRRVQLITRLEELRKLFQPATEKLHQIARELLRAANTYAELTNDWIHNTLPSECHHESVLHHEPGWFDAYYRRNGNPDIYCMLCDLDPCSAGFVACRPELSNDIRKWMEGTK